MEAAAMHHCLSGTNQMIELISDNLEALADTMSICSLNR
jgi:hypothetical protein